MKRTNTLVAVLFLLFLLFMLGLAAIGAPTTLSALKNDWNGRADKSAVSLYDKAEFVTDRGEAALNRGLDRSHLFIQLYGGVQRLSGQQLVEDTSGNDVARLENGAITFCGFSYEYVDPTENAEKTIDFAGKLQARGIPFLMAVAPGKVENSAEELPAVLHDWGNEIADDYLARLNGAGVETLDLRPAFDERTDRADLFFRTDHHWKPEGAFFANQLLWEHLAKTRNFSTNTTALGEETWEKTVYEDFFLGSQGKRVGTLYAGTDNFTVYAPKFSTSLRYEIPERELVKQGGFNEAVCFPERIAEKNLFNGNPYTYYSGGDWAKATMVNEDNPGGAKIVLIRDSYACALAPFLALQCSELTTVDLRYYQGDLEADLTEMSPDLVVMLYTASTTRLSNMFAFEK